MSKERVYIVEDDEIVALDLKHRLEHLGYEVSGHAMNTDRAFDEIIRLKPEMVLMDIMLPGSMDGIDLAIKLRWEENIPSIFVTAWADETLTARAKAAEPLGYLIKPVTDRELTTVLDVALYRNFAETRLRKNEELFSAILNSTTDAIIVINKANHVIFINPEAEELLEISDQDAQEKTPEELFSLSDTETDERIRLPRCPRDTTSIKAGKLRLTNRIAKSFIVELTVSRDGGEHRHTILSFRDISRLHEISDTLKFQTTHDQLTGLLNRNEFSLRMTATMGGEESARAGTWAVFIDIDHFRIVNDACGTDAGDALLRRTADRLRGLCFAGGFASRLGGDDFVVVLSDQVEGAVRALLDDIRNEPFEWMGKSFPITISAGIVPLSRNFRSEHDLMLAGTQLVRQIHESGGNRFEFLTDGATADRTAVSVSDWINLMHEALQKECFRLYYQPIEPLSECASDAKIEILLRLSAADGSIIQPSDFIHIAERYGLMPQIDRWVIDRSFAAWKRLTERKDPLSHRIFSFNLSGASLIDETIISYIIGKTDEHLVDPARFCIEITETNAIHNLTSASRFIYILKEHGFRFALDDFGSGFSSFNYLKNLPVDYLKIDGSFIRNMDRDRVDYTMVQAMSSMGRVLGLETIGEFAQNAEIIRMLREIGVDFAQGYGISEPKPLE